MESIQRWAFSLCAAAVAGAIAEIFAPNGGTKRIFRLCISVFFLCCLFSPVLKLAVQDNLIDDIFPASSASAYENDYIAANELYTERITSAFRNNICRLVKEVLEELGINDAEIQVGININADNCISINEVEITLSKDIMMQKPRIINAISDCIGVVPDICFSKS